MPRRPSQQRTSPATGLGVFRLGALLVLLFVLAAGPASAATITDPGQAPVTLPPGTPAGAELSAIAYEEGSTWRLVSDDTSPTARVLDATIQLDPGTAHIIGAPSLDSDLPLAAGADTEGLALAGDGSLWVSDEVGPSIRRHLADGSVDATLSIPPIFTTGLRGNLGFESLALGQDGSIWTANEEALTSDGPVSSFTDGTIVRIQRFDASQVPAGQWGYVTEKIPGNITGSAAGRDIELSGVVDLAVLPSGELLALERAFGGDPAGLGFPIFEIRIFEIGFGGATETSGLANLAHGSFTPVTKTLLWETTYTLSTGLADFEGIALGPPTDDGDLIALLVADDNGGSSQQVLKSLRITDTASPVPESSGDLTPPLRVAPNPAHDQVRFRLAPDLARATLEIFDASGRRQERLPTERGGQATWSATDASAGIYFVRVSSRPETAVKFTVIR